MGHTGLRSPSDATPVVTTGVVPPRALADALRAVACGPGYEHLADLLDGEVREEPQHEDIPLVGGEPIEHPSHALLGE